jgi:trigger factor
MTESALQVEMENLSEVKRKLRIVVPSDEVVQEVDRAYRELGKRAKVKGFRPGKVPRSILEMYYGKQVEQEVSDSLVRRSLGEALKDRDLEPVNLSWPEPPPPVVAGEDYRYSVELEVNPEFTVEGYQGLQLTAPPVEVSDEEVEARLEEIRQANALLKPPAEDRGAREGDFVVLDYQASYGGQPVAGGKAEGTYMEVGSGKFNEEFERHLLGLKPGGEGRFDVALPDDFANPLLAGKVVEFQVQVHEVKEKVVAELDDAFAQALGGNFKTLADLRTALREDIIKVKERERQALLENQAMDQLLARHQFEVPPTLLAQEEESMLREQWERLAQYGMNPAGMDHSKMVEAVKPLAARRVRVKLVLGRIAAQERFTVEDAEVEAALARIAVHSGKGVPEVRQFYQERDLMGALRRQLQDDQTMKFLLDQASVAAVPEVAAEEKE